MEALKDDELSEIYSVLRKRLVRHCKRKIVKPFKQVGSWAMGEIVGVVGYADCVNDRVDLALASAHAVVKHGWRACECVEELFWNMHGVGGMGVVRFLLQMRRVRYVE
jgi:hypothetical protein